MAHDPEVTDLVRADLRRVKVLYIGGYGRSGSTLLESILGNFPGVVPVGELRHVWNRSFRDNSLCSCGRRFSKCSFWSAVVNEAFGARRDLDIDEIIQLKKSVDRIAYIPRITRCLRCPRGSFGARLQKYAALLLPLYRAVETVGSARVIVDSSKDPSFAFVLASIPDIQLHVVHLVRDSRAVAYSWTRRKRRPELPDEEIYMPRFGPLSSAFRWNAYNYPFHLLKRFVAYRLLHYEELVREPCRVVEQILASVDLVPDEEQLRLLRGDTLQLASNHSMSGNPLRFERRPITLKLDDEWATNLPAHRQLLVGLLTSHLMWRYGYFGLGRRL